MKDDKFSLGNYAWFHSCEDDKFSRGDYAWFHSCESDRDHICRIAEELYEHEVKIVFWRDGRMGQQRMSSRVSGCGCSIKPLCHDDLPELAAWKLLHE